MPDESREAGPRQMPDESREAGPREASSSAPRLWAAVDVARLHAQIELLKGRLAMARFDSRGSATTNGLTTHRLLAWKPGSIRSLPADTSPMDKPGALLSLRREVFDWLRAYSFVLRLSIEERQLLTSTELSIHRDNLKAFTETWTPNSRRRRIAEAPDGVGRHMRAHGCGLRTSKAHGRAVVEEVRGTTEGKRFVSGLFPEEFAFATVTGSRTNSDGMLSKYSQFRTCFLNKKCFIRRI